MDLLEKLSNLDAVASNEDEVRIFLKKELENYADEILYDNLGSIIFKIGNNDKSKIMLDAHIDEVGFIVKNILDNGKILLKELGNVSIHSMNNVRARLTASNKKKIYGVIAGGLDDLHFDIGINNLEEIRKMGIKIGDMVCFDTQFRKYNSLNVVEGKALDNRVGCYILSKILKNLKGKKLKSSIYFAFTSSEEVGLRGGKTSASLINPNVAFVIDVVSTKNIYDNSNYNTRKNGEGFLIEVYDKTFIPSKKMVELVESVAIKEKIKYQLDTMNGGGTNAGEIHKLGVGIPCLVTGVALRYCHGPHSIVNMEDVEGLIKVYTKLLQNI